MTPVSRTVAHGRARSRTDRARSAHGRDTLWTAQTPLSASLPVPNRGFPRTGRFVASCRRQSGPSDLPVGTDAVAVARVGLTVVTMRGRRHDPPPDGSARYTLGLRSDPLGFLPRATPPLTRSPACRRHGVRGRARPMGRRLSTAQAAEYLPRPQGRHPSHAATLAAPPQRSAISTSPAPTWPCRSTPRTPPPADRWRSP